MMTPRANDWLESGGGPLILLSEAVIGQWGGTLLPPHDPVSGDYARAVAIKDYAGVIPVGKGFGLVLGGDPLPARMVALEDGLLIIRVVYAESSDAANAITRMRREMPYEGEPLQFQHFGEAVVLMDSAFPGEAPPDLLQLPLRAGTFMVSTAEYQPDAETFFVVHWLDRL